MTGAGTRSEWKPGDEHFCRVCKRVYMPTSRYFCCNGWQCGCGGATIPFEVCSPECAEKEMEECDHEWEYEGADPSVGIMSGSRTCVKCGEVGPDERGEDFDDNYF